MSEGEEIVFRGAPSFAPEILRKRASCFLPHDGAAAIVGVLGALQLDVLAERLAAEYGLPVFVRAEPV